MTAFFFPAQAAPLTSRGVPRSTECDATACMEPAPFALAAIGRLA